jgi:hypothetical protein
MKSRRLFASILALAILVLAHGYAGQAFGQTRTDWSHVTGTVEYAFGDQLWLQTPQGERFQIDLARIPAGQREDIRQGDRVTVFGRPTGSRQLTAAWISSEDGQASPGAPAIASLVPQFVNSKEFKQEFPNPADRVNADFLVTRLYREMLGRLPSMQERESWSSKLQQSGDVNNVVQGFLSSPEYQRQSRPTKESVVQLYRSLLGRTPSESEVASWMQFLARR